VKTAQILAFGQIDTGRFLKSFSAQFLKKFSKWTIERGRAEAIPVHAGIETEGSPGMEVPLSVLRDPQDPGARSVCGIGAMQSGSSSKDGEHLQDSWQTAVVALLPT
tara:strand:- start:222 stop:542 length:321 start_codon:yes stop_codon:yes gene_type:complete